MTAARQCDYVDLWDLHCKDTTKGERSTYICKMEQKFYACIN